MTTTKETKEGIAKEHIIDREVNTMQALLPTEVLLDNQANVVSFIP
jgi:hypothetical protein